MRPLSHTAFVALGKIATVVIGRIASVAFGRIAIVAFGCNIGFAGDIQSRTH